MNTGVDMSEEQVKYKPIPTTKAELEAAIEEAMSLNIKIAYELRVLSLQWRRAGTIPTFKFEQLSMQLGKMASLIKHLPEGEV